MSPPRAEPPHRAEPAHRALPTRAAPHRWSAVAAVARKELLTSFRDTRTTLYALVLPLVLYPILFWCLIQGAMLAQGRREHATPNPRTEVQARVHTPAAGNEVLAGSSSTDARAATREGEDRGRNVRAAAEAPFLREAARSIAPASSVGGYVLSLLVPVLLVVLTVMGAFFPAVDVTAGERERNTAETTMLLPVPHVHVLLGKIAAVSIAAMLSTALNLLALALSVFHLQTMLAPDEAFRFDVPVRAFFWILPQALLFAVFVSAVLTGVASMARTFREGQALLGPVQLAFIFPALVALMPGIELTPATACIPVVNLSLVVRSLLRGDLAMLELGLTALSLAALSIAAIAVAIRVASRETRSDRSTREVAHARASRAGWTG